jgi:hypothetical protein
MIACVSGRARKNLSVSDAASDAREPPAVQHPAPPIRHDACNEGRESSPAPWTVRVDPSANGPMRSGAHIHPDTLTGVNNLAFVYRSRDGLD